MGKGGGGGEGGEGGLFAKTRYRGANGRIVDDEGAVRCTIGNQQLLRDDLWFKSSPETFVASQQEKIQK